MKTRTRTILATYASDARNAIGPELRGQAWDAFRGEALVHAAAGRRYLGPRGEHHKTADAAIDAWRAAA